MTRKERIERRDNKEEIGQRGETKRGDSERGDDRGQRREVLLSKDKGTDTHREAKGQSEGTK